MKALLVCLILLTPIMLLPTSARATLIPGDTVDFIQQHIGPGGGTFDGDKAPGQLEWFTFDAQVGDFIQIETVLPTGFDTELYLFDDQVDGNPEVGDMYMGAGDDLRLLFADDDGGVGLLSLIEYTVPATGAYIFAVGDFAGIGGGNYFGQLDGNTAPVPEPSTMLLLGSGLLGLFAIRRKFRK